MEDDFSKIVGLGLPMWIFIILFVLLSSSIGEPFLSSWFDTWKAKWAFKLPKTLPKAHSNGVERLDTPESCILRLQP